MLSMQGRTPRVTPRTPGSKVILAGHGPELVTGLDFAAANYATDSEIAIILSGADLLPRIGHTVIVRYKPHQQTGYYGFMWHSTNTGTFDGGAYSWGTHPYPHDTGTTNSSGIRTGGPEMTGGAGLIHYWQNAGLLLAEDWLRSADADGGSGGGYLVAKEVWYTQVRKCRLMTSGPHNGELEHTYIPDLYGNPSFKIVTYCANTLSSPSAPAFYIGASDWSNAGGSASQETVCGIVACLQMYGVWLSDSDHETEAANYRVNTPQTAAGISGVWYMNQSLTPSDVTDKSGAGHNPTWRNASRPILWTGLPV